MLDLPGTPHADICSFGCVLIERGAARICETVEHDQRGGARRMCRREQRRCRERGVRRDENRSSAPVIVEHRGDAVSPLLQGRQRSRSDGIRRSRARLVEDDEPTERCHRLDPPLNRGILRNNLAAAVPARDEHDVASTFSRRAIGDAQFTVEGIARLREHRGSVSRGAH